MVFVVYIRKRVKKKILDVKEIGKVDIRVFKGILGRGIGNVCL